MAESKNSGYKIRVKDEGGEERVLDLIYEAPVEQFILWLRHKGRRYIPYYPGIDISQDERKKEVEIIDKMGKLTPELKGEGERVD